MSKAEQNRNPLGILTDVYMNSRRVAARTGTELPTVRPWQSRSRFWRSCEAARQFTTVTGSLLGAQCSDGKTLGPARIPHARTVLMSSAGYPAVRTGRRWTVVS